VPGFMPGIHVVLNRSSPPSPVIPQKRGSRFLRCPAKAGHLADRPERTNAGAKSAASPPATKFPAGPHMTHMLAARAIPGVRPKDDSPRFRCFGNEHGQRPKDHHTQAECSHDTSPRQTDGTSVSIAPRYDALISDILSLRDSENRRHCGRRGSACEAPLFSIVRIGVPQRATRESAPFLVDQRHARYPQATGSAACRRDTARLYRKRASPLP
jgi:hypothetical protein